MGSEVECAWALVGTLFACQLLLGFQWFRRVVEPVLIEWTTQALKVYGQAFTMTATWEIGNGE